MVLNTIAQLTQKHLFKLHESCINMNQHDNDRHSWLAHAPPDVWQQSNKSKLNQAFPHLREVLNRRCFIHLCLDSEARTLVTL